MLWVVNEHQNRLGIVQHGGDAFARLAGVQRQVGGAALEHGEDGEDLRDAALQAQRHAAFGLCAQCNEVVGQAIGLAVELLVTKRGIGAEQRDGVRCCGNLLGEPLRQAAWFGGGRVMPGEGMQVLALGGREQRQLAYARVVVGEHAI